jgi:hypothetical protein
MQHSREQLDAAISATDLSSRHQKSLRELLSRTRHPLFLGYIVSAFGFACLVPVGFALYLEATAHANGLEMDQDGLQSAASLFFMLALFFMSGSQTYINRIRASRAVSELLVSARGCEHPDGAVTQESAPSAAP